MTTRRKASAVTLGTLAVLAIVIALLARVPERAAPGTALEGAAPDHGVGASKRDLPVSPIVSHAYRARASRLTVVDRLGATPVPRATLRNASGESIGTADEAGVLDLSSFDAMPEIVSAGVLLLSGERVVPAELMTSSASGEATAVVTYTAGIDLSVRASEPLSTSLRGRIYSYPDLPPISGLSAADFEQLRFNRGSPDVYVDLLRKHGLFPDIEPYDHEFGIKLVDGQGRASIDVPIDGPIIVGLGGPGIVQVNTSVRVSLGLRTSIVVQVHGTPSVSGTLRSPDDSAIVEGLVTVTCSILTGPGEMAPYDAKDGGGPAFTIVGEKGSEHATVYATRRCRSKGDGSWKVAMPFTGNVAAYAFVERMDLAIERRSVGKLESVSSITLQPVASDPHRYLTLVDDSTNAPLSNCLFKAYQGEPPDPLQMHYPGTTTDGLGRLRLGWYQSDVWYQAYKIESGNTRYHPLKTKLVPGTTIRCRPVGGSSR
jgi:hypothetical protein